MGAMQSLDFLGGYKSLLGGCYRVIREVAIEVIRMFCMVAIESLDFSGGQ